MNGYASQWLLVAAVFLLAGGVKGVAGMGLPTVAMGLLGLWLPPSQAAALLVLPSLVTNLQQAWGPAPAALLRRLWPVLALVVAGTWLSAGVMIGGNPRFLRAALGVLLVAYALLGLARRQWTLPPRHERWTSPLTGLVGGLLNGATGVLVIPVVPYLSALSLPRELLIRALAACFGTATLALAIALVWHGGVPLSAGLPSLLALVPTAVGVWAGTRVRRRISAELFRRVFFGTLLLLGLQACWQALS
ncbi:sulfite exporter TauE/SafE family protein [Xanthomonas vesicatoria]|uniref:sulfite exporter TauE/SafE family protein n=1 Tax=Xanthomonas vesicatoria TaxID=56460 RepID=UPI0007323033|nr:sulfite exporter TauE/SafE family protein [Xanthomonas vesicatoria]KTF35818.1 permease [Xanthomonas vesicatoria]MCC8558161.1 sulfite exporter TauE/SafE family protein [Xanthomonas vesicatoria]MCC8601047.1 sulfite exporter TauE/SafE family protein [Xanthomonas vesicatoria]MCC8609627.1 sulfite exporter TauE/SafE family protein [Xanthomonas vesicatoria]MCC8674162.1 sulfite exporter TauE/SafE family protein [Xanthomonas vesicatoria]